MQDSREGASKVVICGGGGGPLPEGVEAAAVDLVDAGVGLELGRVAAGVADRLPQPRRLGRLDARPADLLDQQAADEQRLVADRLGVEPEPRPAGQQPVLRVLRQRSGASRGRLPVGGRGDEPAA